MSFSEATESARSFWKLGQAEPTTEASHESSFQQHLHDSMTDAVIFSPDGTNLQAADVLYKKNILAIRGSFRPVTKVNIDMIAKGLARFRQEARVEERNIQVLD